MVKMISWNEFDHGVINFLEKNISKDGNLSQYEIIHAKPSESLFVVAGPGSGKTTSMVLKVLKLIIVDDINPASIIAVTFTRKAAAELKSRILGWGDQLRRGLVINCPDAKDYLEKIDFNKVITGTLDSLSEEILREYRVPGSAPPIVIEDFVSNALMTRVGLFRNDRYKNKELEDYIARLRGRYNLNIGTKSSVLRSIRDRCYNDMVNVTDLLNNCDDEGISTAFDAIRDYENELDENLLYDFVKIEKHFLDKLRSELLLEFLSSIKFVLVDEYQDTNLLQEQIYFELAKAAIRNGGSFTVVGDDDQSLYRFRGATVDLFRSFNDRAFRYLGINPRIKYLTKNYRSNENIVDFCNNFCSLDEKYQNVRVSGKPEIIFSRQGDVINYPVLGMFRDDIETLAQDLAYFIDSVLSEDGFQINDDSGEKFNIQIDIDKGSPSDITFLCSSPQELNGNGIARLPFHLRECLNNLDISVFNPRGQNLKTVDEVQILCGLILECIDPNYDVQDNNNFPEEALNMFAEWRSTAFNHIENCKYSKLNDFVDAWQCRKPLGKKKWDAREVPIIDLVYKLITWMPVMQNDIEGLVYVEAITRTISQSALFSSFRSQIIIDPDNKELENASIKEAYWNIFVPIATGAIEIDEELLETLPNNRINIMSIHQAKGLEFPLLIIDVGSEFRSDHHTQAFKRFPKDDDGEVGKLENQLRDCCPLRVPSRSIRDRCFDDLTRLYFVGYSRPKDILLLVGLNSVKNGYSTNGGSQRTIPHVATGWDRNGKWHWGRGLTNLIHI